MRHWRTARKRAKTAVLLTLMLLANLAGLMPYQSHAATVHMMAFWDPSFGTVPSGWTVMTSFNGRFPRGDTVANYGLTGANDTPRTPTVATITVGLPTTTAPAPGTGNTGSSDTHTHPNPTVTVGPDSNSDLPAFRSLQLIQYSTGIPTFIPAGVILMFDTNGAIPSGFTQVTAQNDKMIRVNSTVATGGSDTATNTVAIGPLPNTTDVGYPEKNQNNQVQVAAITHGHLAPPNGTTTAVSTVPPYVQPQLAQANGDTTTIPAATVAMFDGDPGVGWVVVSGAGGAYNQQFLRPSATANLTSQGALTHTPPAYSVLSGTPNVGFGSQAKSNGNGQGVALQTHQHQIDVTFNSVSNLPPYFNVVIAQKVSFTLQNYRWYADSNANAVTDPWPSGTLDVAQNGTIPAIPAAYNPPTVGTQLRLRWQALVSGQALPASTIQFKMQYKQGTDGSCTSGTWTDLGTGAAWGYGTNSVADNSTLTSSVLTPTSSVLELFSKSAPTAVNPNAVATGQTMEYDMLIKDNSATGASQYSFRMVESSGNPLSQYVVCPTLVTSPSTDQEMRHGNFFQDEQEAGYEWAN